MCVGFEHLMGRYQFTPLCPLPMLLFLLKDTTQIFIPSATPAPHSPTGPLGRLTLPQVRKWLGQHLSFCGHNVCSFDKQSLRVTIRSVLWSNTMEAPLCLQVVLSPCQKTGEPPFRWNTTLKGRVCPESQWHHLASQSTSAKPSPPLHFQLPEVRIRVTSDA